MTGHGHAVGSCQQSNVRQEDASVVQTQGEQPRVTRGQQPRKPSWFKRFVDWLSVLFT